MMDSSIGWRIYLRLLPRGRGVVIGLLAAAAMGRLLTSLLYGVTSFDPLTFVGGSVIFLAVAALAGIIPALKAARIPPAVALQST